MVYVPAGKTIEFLPPKATDSWIAARSVHSGDAGAGGTWRPVSQTPSPSVASGRSAVLFTVKVAAWTSVSCAKFEPTARARITNNKVGVAK
jgi:hypothetical protein